MNYTIIIIEYIIVGGAFFMDKKKQYNEIAQNEIEKDNVGGNVAILIWIRANLKKMSQNMASSFHRILLGSHQKGRRKEQRD